MPVAKPRAGANRLSALGETVNCNRDPVVHQ